QSARAVVPGRPTAREDRDLRLELRGVVERAGIEVGQAGHDLGRAVDDAVAGRAREARRRPAAATGRGVGARRAFDRDGGRVEAQPADMATPRQALAVAAMAKALR